jgi:hypothetical protein
MAKRLADAASTSFSCDEVNVVPGLQLSSNHSFAQAYV